MTYGHAFALASEEAAQQEPILLITAVCNADWRARYPDTVRLWKIDQITIDRQGILRGPL
jgi:hypothetical protein